MTFEAAVINANSAHPEMTQDEISGIVGCSKRSVRMYGKIHNLTFAPKGDKLKRELRELMSKHPKMSNIELAKILNTRSDYISKLKSDIRKAEKSVTLNFPDRCIYDFIKDSAGVLDLTPEEYILEIIEDRMAEEAEKLK